MQDPTVQNMAFKHKVRINQVLVDGSKRNLLTSDSFSPYERRSVLLPSFLGFMGVLKRTQGGAHLVNRHAQRNAELWQGQLRLGLLLGTARLRTTGWVLNLRLVGAADQNRYGHKWNDKTNSIHNSLRPTSGISCHRGSKARGKPKAVPLAGQLDSVVSSQLPCFKSLNGTSNGFLAFVICE